jgi:prevent-host-death family protein
MEPVNILEARNRLSQLVAAASSGEDVVISKRGKPIVRMVAIEDNASRTGAALAEWLAAHPLPVGSVRTPQELDEQIVQERGAWD